MLVPRAHSIEYTFSDCVHTKPPHFENSEKYDGSKISASVHTIPEQFETVGNLTIKNSLQEFDAKKCTYTLRVDQSRSESLEKCSVYIIVECSHDAVSNFAG